MTGNDHTNNNESSDEYSDVSSETPSDEEELMNQSDSDDHPDGDEQPGSNNGSNNEQSDAARAIFEAHLDLIKPQSDDKNLNEITTTPLFTGVVANDPRITRVPDQLAATNPAKAIQYGLLGGDVEMLKTTGDGPVDPRVFFNVTSPSSVFICGSQGSGKSHTLSCLLENCLLSSKASVLSKPLAGVVFHYDSFSSDTGGSPCEAAYLSSNKEVKVRVLCSPTNVQTIKHIYRRLPNVTVEELLIDHSNLNTKRMLDLMAVGTGEMPLYLQVVKRVLRDMRIQQQHSGNPFVYSNFKELITAENLSPMQCAPLHQRLDTLESFMPRDQTTAAPAGKNAKKRKISCGTDWRAQSGELTIVDLSCPCVPPEMACALFNICLSLFLEQGTGVGRVVALDEAHKYMNDSPESLALTNNLMGTIRLQRHLGARVIISTQEPSISPKLLDLCSITIVHRFSSPDWLRTLKEHLAGVSFASRLEQRALAREEEEEDLDIRTVRIDNADPVMGLFSMIVNLRVGEALVFAPSAIVGRTVASDKDGDQRFVGLGNGILRLQIRARVTADGGQSLLAT